MLPRAAGLLVRCRSALRVEELISISSLFQAFGVSSSSSVEFTDSLSGSVPQRGTVPSAFCASYLRSKAKRKNRPSYQREEIHVKAADVPEFSGAPSRFASD